MTPEQTTRLEEARALFDSDLIYLNTATLGLPPRHAWHELQDALYEWRSGTAYPPKYDASVNRARRAYAELCGLDPNLVATGSQASPYVGLIAGWLPDGAEVLIGEGEFTSLLFPFLAQAGRGIKVREVPLERLADEVRPGTTLVAVSAVQSSNGYVTDLDVLRTACAATGTEMLVDLTQAAGWLPVDASQYAFTVASGYKWLLSPRGTAYFSVRADLLDQIIPANANWYAGQDPWDSIYGSPLRLAPDARRLDLSPAWHSWIAAAPALELLRDIGAETLHAHSTGLAARFRTACGLRPSNSAIVSAVADPEVPELLKAARIVGAVRAGRLRLSFHLSTSQADTDRAAELLHPHLRD
ncbi:aminotransferase class V-fold PLP-dependent enzyme [Kribbella deserti]|uniref:Aminotransferase class V-fold PLP-dependent enzyme n=1 Tax=Kribbella deserti TaxID=1926257 RepID=A0ABV6QYZ5_9ACTN